MVFHLFYKANFFETEKKKKRRREEKKNKHTENLHLQHLADYIEWLAEVIICLITFIHMNYNKITL